jgi:uncharacterized delta-60 repeat protein
MFFFATPAAEWTGAGAVDTTAIGAGTDGTVNAVAILADGSTLVAGTFTTVHGVTKKNIARLLPDWTVDPSFDSGTGPDSTVNDLAVQPDGKIVIVGSFNNVAGTPRKYVARLTSTGALDSTFAIPGTGPSSTVNKVALQSTGRILVAGSFSTLSGMPYSGCARLDSTGTVDTSFQATASSIKAIAVLPDDRIVIGGSFFDVNGLGFSQIARLMPGGTVDLSFIPAGDPTFTDSAVVLAEKRQDVRGRVVHRRGHAAQSNSAHERGR